MPCRRRYAESVDGKRLRRIFNFGKGGGGGGDDDGGGSKGTLQVLFLLFCILFVFYGLKPMVDTRKLGYYGFKIQRANRT